jgi:adenylate cyclase class 2
MSEAGLEIEIKLRVADEPAARRLLRRLRARSLGRIHEQNTLFDTAENVLGRSGRILRVRHVQKMGQESSLRNGSRPRRKLSPPTGVLTFKAPVEGGRYKAREEIEVSIDPPERAEHILGRLGYRPWFRYEKFRTTFRLPGLPRLSVELDETPVGVFFELEGPRDSIDRAARRLGYQPSDYLNVSYYELFLEQRERLGLPPDAMVFPSKE